VKEIVILGGPNGVGKTTAAKVLLPEFFEQNAFLNADEFAREISSNDAEAAAFAAGRRMIGRMREFICQDRSFWLETTCSGKSYLPLLERCKLDGWRIKLLFFWLPFPEMAIGRVAQRVSQGGHNIPGEVVYRRYFAGISNMVRLYLPLADEAEIYDNSDRRRILIAEKRETQPLLIHDKERWVRIEEAAR
jgi:predicted ABC-type ATPase